jgi:hypothetical protein
MGDMSRCKHGDFVGYCLDCNEACPACGGGLREPARFCRRCGGTGLVPREPTSEVGGSK